MKKTKKKTNFFPIILAIIILFFSIVIFLSIPVLFDYKSIEKQIEKKFYSEFKINLKNLDEITYKFIPKPHLLIKKANLNLDDNNENSSIIETENLKIFIPLESLYSKSKIKIDSLEIQNTNFIFKFDDIVNFRNHLYYKINKPILIKKSKLFYLNKKNNTILISPIYKLNYSENNKENYKKFKISGNIFDLDYSSSWKRYYEKPKSSQNEIKFKDINLTIKNKFKFENNLKFKGNIDINFLNEILNIDYFYSGNKIIVESPDLNQKIKIYSNIELDPFYFDTKIIFIEKNLNFLIDEFLFYITDAQTEFLKNLNGILKIKLENLENEIINNGEIILTVNEKSVDLEKSNFNISDVGSIKSEFRYIEKNGDLIFSSNNVLEIENKKSFSKKFQVKPKYINKINKIFFKLEKNVDTKEISISNININEKSSLANNDKIYLIKNIHELKSLLKKILST